MTAVQSADGVNQYFALYENATSARNEMLINLDPPAKYFGQYFIGQAAYRWQQWKLIMNMVATVALRLRVTHCSPIALWITRPTAHGTIRARPRLCT